VIEVDEPSEALFFAPSQGVDERCVADVRRAHRRDDLGGTADTLADVSRPSTEEPGELI
jgi:hypothetical protein